MFVSMYVRPSMNQIWKRALQQKKDFDKKVPQAGLAALHRLAPFFILLNAHTLKGSSCCNFASMLSNTLLSQTFVRRN